MRITRDILPEDFTFDGKTKSEFCAHINRWKTLLLSRGAKHGDLVAHAILTTNINHMSAIFAIAELGMRLLIIDKPVTAQTMHMTKMGIFGPVDFALECHLSVEHSIHHDMVSRYSKQIISEMEYEAWEDASETFTTCSEHDKFLLASTSGTTATTTPIWFTHDTILKISERNKEIFKFYKDSRVIHYRNMHHASSLLTYIFPAFLGSSANFSGTTFNGKLERLIPDYVVPLKINRLIAANMFELARIILSIIESGETLEETVLINMSGFTVTQKIIDFAKQYNLEFVSHYGSIDTGIPLLVNYVDANTVFDPGYLGKQPDDFYGMESRDGLVNITSQFWEGERIIGDYLEKRGENWYHKGRLDRDPIQEYVSKFAEDALVVSVDGKRYLVLWDEYDHSLFHKIHFEKIITLDKETFTVDTKVNMDQLREYIRCGSGK